MAHIHAKLMMDYAQDAMEHDKPWLLWESKEHDDKEWRTRTDHPRWVIEVEYRRKPNTININGFEVPEPLCKRPKENINIYVVALQIGEPLKLNSDSARPTIFTNRVAHLSKNDCQIHIDALLSFTKTIQITK